LEPANKTMSVSSRLEWMALADSATRLGHWDAVRSGHVVYYLALGRDCSKRMETVPSFGLAGM